MAAQAGIEPALGLLQACVAAAVFEIAAIPNAQLRAQKRGELQEVVAAWPNLSPDLRTAVLAVTRAATKRLCRKRRPSARSRHQMRCVMSIRILLRLLCELQRNCRANPGFANVADDKDGARIEVTKSKGTNPGHPMMRNIDLLSAATSIDKNCDQNVKRPGQLLYDLIDDFLNGDFGSQTSWRQLLQLDI